MVIASTFFIPCTVPIIVVPLVIALGRVARARTVSSFAHDRIAYSLPSLASRGQAACRRARHPRSAEECFRGHVHPFGLSVGSVASTGGSLIR